IQHSTTTNIYTLSLHDALPISISNLEFTSDIKNLSECNLVIEAALEDIELKKELYKKLDEITSNDCILATNTSSFSITAISSAEIGRAHVNSSHLVISYAVFCL